MCPSLWLFIPMSLFMATDSHNYYYFINESKSWNDSQSYCRQNYTDLATVWEESDLGRLCVEQVDCSDAWIGLYNQDKDISNYKSIHRIWHWSGSVEKPGEPPVTWSPYEPNDNNGRDNCVFMYANMTFADDSCCNRHHFICYNQSSNTLKLSTDKKTWLEALHFCRQTYTDLLSGPQIHHPTLQDLLNQTGDTGRWVGLYRDPWAWSGHNDSSFRNWSENYTLLCQDASVSYGQCAKLGEKNKWMSDKCAEKHPFICYVDNLILITENLTWEEARDYCRTNYSALASITSEAQQRQAQLRAREAKSEYVWLGSYFTCFLELWRWVNGEFLVYENWNHTEASECDQCAALERGRDNKWFKMNQSERYNFLCTVK